TSFTHKPGPPDDKNGYVEVHTGPKPSDNYTLEKTADGKYKIKDDSGEKVIDKYNEKNPDWRIERARLKEAAEANIKNPEDLIRFQQDMARFEIRMKNLEDTYAKQGLSPEKAHEKAEKELAATAHELTRLLEAKDNPKLGVSAADRVLLAEQ